MKRRELRRRSNFSKSCWRSKKIEWAKRKVRSTRNVNQSTRSSKGWLRRSWQSHDILTMNKWNSKCWQALWTATSKSWWSANWAPIISVSTSSRETHLGCMPPSELMSAMKTSHSRWVLWILWNKKMLRRLLSIMSSGRRSWSKMEIEMVERVNSWRSTLAIVNKKRKHNMQMPNC